MEADSSSVIIFLVGLIAVDLFVVAMRRSFGHASLARLVALREQEERAVRRAVDLIHKIDYVDASLQFIHLLCWFLVVGAILQLWAPLDAPFLLSPGRWGLLVLTALVAFYLEMGVEAVVVRRPETWAIRLSFVTGAIVWILTPFATLAQLMKFGQRMSPEPQSSVTQDELISLLDAGQQEGVLEQDEHKMIYSIFRLDDTLAREIMVPRIYITALDVDISLTEAVDALLTSGHSRVPVFEENIDNIIGLVYAKDLLQAWRKNSQKASLRSLLREVYFVPEAKMVDELLDEMQAREVHMAIVVDEYGGIAGLVTLEDIVEEIVGEIRDEYDQAEELPYQVVGPGEYLVQGRIDLDDFNDLMQSELPLDEAETLSGFIYNQMGRVPENDEQVVVDNLELTVEQVVGRRIRKVRARSMPDPEQLDRETEETGADG